MEGSDVTSLVELRLGGDSVTDKWTDDGRTEGHILKNSVVLTHLYSEGKCCSKFG